MKIRHDLETDHNSKIFQALRDAISVQYGECNGLCPAGHSHSAEATFHIQYSCRDALSDRATRKKILIHSKNVLRVTSRVTRE